MARLLDGLLKLFQVTLSELRLEQVDLSRLARAALARHALADPTRAVVTIVQDGLVVEGDQKLLAIALEQLVSNAWKFTAGKPGARIEFGADTRAGLTTYFVRDDGVGFDMAYASKIFGVFQRLHPPGAYAGTGVGLAAAQRIIHRHGGRICADGKPGEGATFYFTLSDATPAPPPAPAGVPSGGP